MTDPAYIPSESIKKVAEKIGVARFDEGNWHKYTREAHEFLLCFYAAMDLPRPTGSHVSEGKGYDTPPKVEVSSPPKVTEMVERVAKEIANEGDGVSTSHWQKLVPEERRNYYRIAKTAIRAMRRPTADMLENSRLYMDSWSSNVAWWQSMIDAALGE